jgi:dipeptidyl aminopeptidase/acylaminoacyl peptidase
MKPPVSWNRILICTLAAAFVLSAQTKRPLTHKDYDAWRTISSPTLSRDGKFLAYAYMPEDGDGDLVVRNLQTGKEWREPVGALPPPPIVDPAEANPEKEPPRRGITIRFTSDSLFLVASTYPPKADVEQAKKDKKKPENMPKTGILMLNLSTGGATRVADVKNFQVPEKGGAWVAYRKEAKPEEKAKDEKPKDEKSKDDKSKEYGADLVLRDLARPQDRSFANALDYSFARDGKTLVYTVSSRKEEENGVFAVTPASEAAPAALLAGKGKYVKLTWSRAQNQLAFVSSHDDADSKTPKWKVYHWDRQAAAAQAWITDATPGFPSKFAISDKGTPAFSRDGKYFYVPAAKPPKPEKDADTSAGSDKVLMDVWNYRDGLVQPMQRIRANQERNRTYRGAYDIAARSYAQIEDENMESATFSDQGTLAIGANDKPYRRMIDYDGDYFDVYVVNDATAEKKMLVRQLRSAQATPLQWSPNGKWALYYNAGDWHIVSLPEGASRNVTGSLGPAFHDEEDDTPDPPSSYGTAGWTRDGQSVLLYDRYDVWQVFADGRAARSLTAGAGRREKIQFRVVDINPPDPDDEERGIDTSKPLYFRAESEESRDSGFYRGAFNSTAPPQRLLWGAKNYAFVAKAKDAGAVLITAARFDEFPDLQLTGTGFAAPQRVTNGAAQMEPFAWGTAELIRFRNADGVALSAALYKPANFDPAKKYPLMVYIYEKLSEDVNNFVNPAPGHSINISYYVSNGYLVLTPDIVYTIGNPGQSALKCVLPAVQEVVDKGFVNENAIGIQGHSWGGYQIAYMITQTTRFKAAEAGAPVGNMTSAYSGIRWGTGLPRQFQYEKTQSRIGPSLYEAPLKYVENSPIFGAPRVQTPLLILHNDNDDAVPWYQGIELFLALRRNGKEVYLCNYNGEFHGLRRRYDQMDWTVRLQQFFDHKLKGAPAPEWMERGVPYIEREEEKERFLKSSDK